MSWRNYTDFHAPHTVHGRLLERTSVWSPQLRNRRDLLVALPPDYDSNARRYPVLYMHDGQNLFDDHASYCGEWHVDETMHVLAAEGLAAIVVGLPNKGKQRILEYSPFQDTRFGDGRGERYVRWIVETVKPMIDQEFRTLPGAATTGIMGSSMGGLISLYGWVRWNEVFGFAGVMSPSLWFAGRAIFEVVRAAPQLNGAIYLDMGANEWAPRIVRSDRAQQENPFVADARALRDLLHTRDVVPDVNLRYVEDAAGMHSEKSWAARLPDALRFWLYGIAAPDRAQAVVFR